MERKQLEYLKEWYKKKNRKPLIIWGARQVGKSYLIEEMFLKQNFKDYVYIDLKKDDDSRAFFQTTSNPKKYLSYIEARFNKKISNSLPLAFDEVQVCHQVLTSLKYFCQDYPELPVIVTGSLVRLALEKTKNSNDEPLFPVGKVNSMNMYPLTFEEYLMNANKVLLERIKASYQEKKPLQEYEHELALNMLYEYLAIGGMPEVVNTFLAEKSYVDASEIKRQIYDNYLSDMDSYNISYETVLKTRNVYNNIFAQLNKENKNFKISTVEKGKSNRDYFGAYRWLELAKVIYISSKKDGKVTTPLISDNKGLFRIYLADSGMFTYQSRENNANFFVKDKRNTLSGIFYENYVACELSAKDIQLFYWCGKSEYEFEFIVEINGSIIPIDVKKKKGKLNSLVDFRNHNERTIAIKISSNNYGYDQENMILTIPLYEVFLLAEDIKNNKITV